MRWIMAMVLLWVGIGNVEAEFVWSFTPLGDLPGGDIYGWPNGAFYSYPFGVSDDGNVVVGASRSAAAGAYYEAFRWTEAKGMVGLGDLAGGRFWSAAYGISGDGAVIIGTSESSVDYEAFRWTEAEGMVGLGDLAGGKFYSQAGDVSVDGSVVVGWSYSAVGNEAFRWTKAGGMVGWGSLGGGISADGSVVVGGDPTTNQPFRWTEGGGMVGLGSLDGGGFQSGASKVSADGSTVVGYSRTSKQGESEAFRWTAAEGMVGLGDLPDRGGTIYQSHALGVSADGSTVVGLGNSKGRNEAFVWDETNGMRDLKDVLVRGGLGSELTGWWLERANDVSADGRTLVGWGVNPSGQFEAWRAKIGEGSGPPAAVPELSTFLLVGLGLGVAGLFGYRDHRRHAT